MSYEHSVLARKWRPKKFNELVGQQINITILKNIISSKKLHHAYLLTGSRGVGKTTIARIIAKALNCLNLKESEPCTTCKNCLEIDSGKFIDVIEVDAASNTGVDNVREIINNSQYAPTQGQYKIYIIDEVHMLSKPAFNSMLKTLEEPPSHIIFILATTDPQKIPITVLSRTLQLKLRNLTSHEIAQQLKFILKQESIDFEISALDIIANCAKGSMRDALSLLDQTIAYSDKQIKENIVRQMLGISDDSIVFKLLDAICTLNGENLINLSQTIYHDGHDLENVLQNLNRILCEISLIQLIPNKKNDALNIYAQNIGVNDIQLYFEITNLALEQITKTADKYPIFIMTMLRMLAFNIGGHENQKALLNSNYNIEEPTKTKTTNIVPTQITTHQETIENPKKNFDGDWFKLIENLKPKLAHLYPFVANAQLVEFKNGTFVILVESGYKSSLNKKAITELSKVFTNFFEYDIEIKVDFANNLDNTLKIKINTEKTEAQLLANEAINKDLNLNKMIDLFSAKILPESIKPLV